MAFSRQHELIRTQELVWKQQLKKNRHRRRVSRGGDTEDAAPSFEGTEGPLEPEVETYTPLESEKQHGTIFVSVASYRDSECPRTVADCFDKATYPGRVFVGVCQQNDTADVDCLASATAQRFMPNIRVMRLPHHEAKGPAYARALIEQNLFADEDYYLVIDSHTLFVPGWDIQCIQQLALCNSDKPVLTCYPPEFDLETRELPSQQHPVFLKHRDFHPRLGFAQQDPVRFKHPPPQPQPSLFWAAGFSFGLGEVARVVPYDLNVQYTFLGEEICMAARLYTHGYDTFAPMSNIVFHHASRTYRPTFWDLVYKRKGQSLVPEDVRLQRKALEREGNLRMHRLLRGEPIEAPYGLGIVRSLLQFQEHVGLDLTHRTSTQHARLGLSPNADETERHCKYGLRSFS